MSRAGVRGQEGLDDDTRDALGAALAAEHAAIWCHGLASAFLPGSARADLTASAEAHRARRDALDARLRAAGADPVPAAASYRTPAPVTDAVGAAGLLAVADEDAAAAWRAVVERTDDPALRRTGLDAVVSTVTTGLPWRRLAGRTPVVPVLPGTG